MRIRSLEINGLFGMFDYQVPMKLEDRITILHGPNGFGKTTILRLVNSLFQGRYAELRRIPFEVFQIELENGTSLRITKHHDEHQASKSVKQKKRLASLLIQLLKDGKELYRSESEPVSLERLPYPVEYISQWIPALVRIRPEIWRYAPTGEEWQLDELLEQFGDRIPYPSPDQRRPEDEWLHKFRDTIKVRFIESQRLLRMANTGRGAEQPASMEPSVAFYAGLLAKAIQETLAKYAALSQELDRSFPVRLVEQIQAGPQLSGALAVDQVRNRLKQLENKREQLRAAGLLDKQEDYRFQVPTQLEETTQKVLPVYVRDVEKKLDVFNEIAEKIEVLKGIINTRFFSKEMSINKERGFSFTTRDNRPLAPTLLSTGEQHMLVLLSELLFAIEPNSLVMIDEPEISLHVEWQQSFLRDLKRVADLSTIDILMATHSPQIIHDRWDLAVQLDKQELAV